MEKFGLFDVIEKLAPLKKTAESILPVIKNLQENAKKTNPAPAKPKAYSPNASILSYIKRHEEMSKRIDKNN